MREPTPTPAARSSATGQMWEERLQVGAGMHYTMRGTMPLERCAERAIECAVPEIFGALFGQLQPTYPKWPKRKNPATIEVTGPFVGAGSGDRTRIPGLGSLCPTIGRYPQVLQLTTKFRRDCQHKHTRTGLARRSPASRCAHRAHHGRARSPVGLCVLRGFAKGVRFGPEAASLAVRRACAPRSRLRSYRPRGSNRGPPTHKR